MANEQNLVKIDSTEKARELGRKGGIASGKSKREKATMKQMLEICLNMKNDSGQSFKELATLGLIKGAISGNSNNYRTILETLGELDILHQERQTQQLVKVEELLSKLDEEAKK